MVPFFFSHKNVHPVQLNHYRPGQTLRAPGSWFKLQELPPYSAHEGGKVVSPTHWPSLTPGDIPGSHLCYRLRRLEGHSAVGGIMSMKTSNDPFGNGACNLPACSCSVTTSCATMQSVVSAAKLKNWDIAKCD